MTGAPRLLTGLLASVLVGGVALGAAGCTDSGRPAGGSSGASCVPAATAPAPTASPGAATRLPDVALSCLDGGASVRVAGLGEPVIINLWASWCTPCRAELPAIQAYAASGRVRVLGVNTQDTTTGARSTIDEFGLTFPILSDPNKQLLTAVGRSALPATLFVDADGGLRYVYATGTPLTEADLARLANQYLGVGG